jgi:hypothetical protein
MLKIAIFGQKAQGILGVNMAACVTFSLLNT